MDQWVQLTKLFRNMITGMNDLDLMSAGCYQSLMARQLESMDDLEQATWDVVEALGKRDYYKLLEHIERGEKIIAEETDPKRKAGYQKFMLKLLADLEKAQHAQQVR